MAIARHAFLLGCQRSGTTILANCLNIHPDIAHFYEPFYLWDKLLVESDNDVPHPDKFTESFQRDIRKAYSIFASKSKKLVVLDKSPQHCYKVEYVHKVFPEAKWIHLVRDGRAVALSTFKEWKLRNELADKRRFLQFYRVARRSLRLQPYWYFRIKQILYWLPRIGGPGKWLEINKSKWKGKIGFGMRFPGWEEVLADDSILKFNGRQWAQAVQHAQAGLSTIPQELILEVRYEDFIKDPQGTLQEITRFLDLKCPEAYLKSIPEIDSEPENKWRNELSTGQLAEIATVLNDKLVELGYDVSTA